MADTPFRHGRGRGRIPIPPVVVLGLGRFGSAVAAELSGHGVEVLGLDLDARTVRAAADILTDAACGDATDAETLRQFGVHEVDRVVLGIGTDLKASILTAYNLVNLGVPEIWAKVDSDAHATILTQVGVHHVVRPERDTGRRVAHLLGGRFQDFAQFDEDYGMIKISPPAELVGNRVDLETLWREQHVRGVSIRPGGAADSGWEPLETGRVLSRDDLIIVAGTPRDLEGFVSGPLPRAWGRTAGVGLPTGVWPAS